MRSSRNCFRSMIRGRLAEVDHELVGIEAGIFSKRVTCLRCAGQPAQFREVDCQARFLLSQVSLEPLLAFVGYDHPAPALSGFPCCASSRLERLDASPRSGQSVHRLSLRPRRHLSSSSSEAPTSCLNVGWRRFPTRCLRNPPTYVLRSFANSRRGDDCLGDFIGLLLEPELLTESTSSCPYRHEPSVGTSTPCLRRALCYFV